MDPSTRDLITWTLGTIIGLATIGGMLARFVLLPWLQVKLVHPVAETHRQVSENGHVDRTTPTIPDRLEDLAGQVDEASEAHHVLARGLGEQQRTLREHLTLSERWMSLVDRELALLQARHRQNGD